MKTAQPAATGLSLKARLPGIVRAERLVAKRFMCPLKIVQNYVFFPEGEAGEPKSREPDANVLRRSVNDSVLKLDALSTGLTFDYLNLGFLRIFLRMRANIVVFELQSKYTDNVVVLQTAFFAPSWLVIAQSWCNFT
jgi:hypothetical protein